MKRERAISFDADVLEQAERRAGETGSGLSAFVNDAVRRALGPGAGVQLAAGAAPDGADAYRAGYLAALLDRDARKARETVDAALAAGVTVADVYTDIFTPALYEIGHKWAMDEINVAHEHFATTLTQTLMATVSPGSRTPPTEGRLAVVTSTPQELHVLGAQMVADLLEREGWEVLGLGAATPAADLVELVEMERPDLVALSATTAGRLPGVAEVLPMLAALDPRPLIAIGGSMFTPETAVVARDLGADLVLSDVRELLAELRERF